MWKIVSTLALLAVIQQANSLQCYVCTTACEKSGAEERSCGDSIGPSQEAVCTTQSELNNNKPEALIRRCQIRTKGHQLPCTEGDICTACSTDLCNSAPGFAPSKLALFIVAAIAILMVPTYRQF